MHLQRAEERENLMGEDPKTQSAEKGFWNGGPVGHGHNQESSGRPSGLPGERKPGRTGVRTDIDFPEQNPRADKPSPR